MCFVWKGSSSVSSSVISNTLTVEAILLLIECRFWCVAIACRAIPLQQKAYTVQQFRQRLSHKSVKVHPTMPIGILGSNSSALLDWGSQCFRKKEGESMITRVCAVSFYHTETPWASIKQPWTTLTHRTCGHCRVRFYAFVGQPFSKQLYIRNQACIETFY